MLYNDSFVFITLNPFEVRCEGRIVEIKVTILQQGTKWIHFHFKVLEIKSQIMRTQNPLTSGFLNLIILLLFYLRMRFIFDNLSGGERIGESIGSIKFSCYEFR